MEKVKETVSKNGLYIKIGALIVSFIGMFLDFLKVSAKGTKQYISESYLNYKDLYDGMSIDYKGLGVLVLILIIVTLVYVLSSKYAKELYEKVPAKIAPFVAIATSGVALIVTLYDAISYKSRIVSETYKATKDLVGKDYAKTAAKQIKESLKVSPSIGCVIIVLGLVVFLAVVVYEEFFMNKAKKEPAK